MKSVLQIKKINNNKRSKPTATTKRQKKTKAKTENSGKWAETQLNRNGKK